ncbi:MAG: hypothetical protein ACPGUD_03165 [Parashewanella sp.]
MFSNIAKSTDSLTDSYPTDPIDDSTVEEPDEYCAKKAIPLYTIDWLVSPSCQSFAKSYPPFDTSVINPPQDGLSFDSSSHFVDLCAQLRQRRDIPQSAYYLCAKHEFLKGFTQQGMYVKSIPKYGAFICDHVSKHFLSFIQKCSTSMPLMFGTCLFLNKLIQDFNINVAIDLLSQMQNRKYSLIATQLAQYALDAYSCRRPKLYLQPYIAPLSKLELIQLADALLQDSHATVWNTHKVKTI